MKLEYDFHTIPTDCYSQLWRKVERNDQLRTPEHYVLTMQLEVSLDQGGVLITLRCGKTQGKTATEGYILAEQSIPLVDEALAHVAAGAEGPIIMGSFQRGTGL